MPRVGRRKLSRFGAVALIGVLGLGWLAAREGWFASHTIARFATIDLNRPDAYFLDWRLSALKSDRELCRRVVKAPPVLATEVEDWNGAEGCGWTNALRLRSAGGIKVSVDRISCELTAALALWLTHEVQPRAVQMLGEPVAALEHLGGYACRNIRGSPVSRIGVARMQPPTLSISRHLF